MKEKKRRGMKKERRQMKEKGIHSSGDNSGPCFYLRWRSQSVLDDFCRDTTTVFVHIHPRGFLFTTPVVMDVFSLKTTKKKTN